MSQRELEAIVSSHFVSSNHIIVFFLKCSLFFIFESIALLSISIGRAHSNAPTACIAGTAFNGGRNLQLVRLNEIAASFLSLARYRKFPGLPFLSGRLVFPFYMGESRSYSSKA